MWYSARSIEDSKNCSRGRSPPPDRPPRSLPALASLIAQRAAHTNFYLLQSSVLYVWVSQNHFRSRTSVIAFLVHALRWRCGAALSTVQSTSLACSLPRLRLSLLPSCFVTALRFCTLRRAKYTASSAGTFYDRSSLHRAKYCRARRAAFRV